MKGGRNRSAMVVALALLAAGCAGAGPRFIDLSYRQGAYVHKLTPVRVGVYYLEDERPGWPASAAMRMFDGGHGKNVGMRHTEGDKDMNVFVAESLRTELAAAGMKVSASKLFNRSNVDATADGTTAAHVDRVVMGRINYFGFVSPVPGPDGSSAALGFAVGGIPGAVVAGKLSTLGQAESAAYVDLDIWVVQPSTGKIVWAGTARGERKTADLSGVVADRVAVLLPEVLHAALNQAIPRTDFIAAMGATLLPVNAATLSTAHHRNAQSLFQAERFTEAAVEFQNAYRESGDAALVFNVGLCYRRSGDAKQAKVAFDEYVRIAPKSPPRPTVEERITELKRQRRYE